MIMEIEGINELKWSKVDCGIKTKAIRIIERKIVKEDEANSDDVIESRYALNIDNIHPWGYEGFPIFSESQSEVTFPTEQFSTTGFRVIENWINKKNMVIQHVERKILTET